MKEVSIKVHFCRILKTNPSKQLHYAPLLCCLLIYYHAGLSPQSFFPVQWQKSAFFRAQALLPFMLFLVDYHAAASLHVQKLLFVAFETTPILKEAI